MSFSDRAKTWKDFYTFFKVPRSVFDKYRSGYLTLPEGLFIVFNNNLSSEKRRYYLSRINYISDNWGKIKGGKVTYSLHKDIFDRGRVLGLKKISNDRSLRDNIPLDKELNEGLSYFLGLFIGDGFTNVYNNRYIIQFTGNWTKELNFYEGYVSTLVNNLFSLKPYIRRDKLSNAIRFNFFSKDLYFLITERFGISAGRKSYFVLIPDEIINSSKDILFSCIAGIYDAECCVFLDKRKKYNEPYPRIDLHMINPGIIQQIGKILRDEGVSISFDRKFTKLSIYGKRNIIYFLDKVKLRNPKNIKIINKFYSEYKY